MFNENNYHLGTKGTFNVVSTNKIKSMFNAFKLQGFDIDATELESIFYFNDKKYKYSFCSFGNYGSLSIYFIVNDKQLLRLSDHWSDGCKNLIVRKCGSISSCYWKLQGNSFPFYYDVGSEILKTYQDYSYFGNPFYYKDWKKITNCLIAGILNLNELKENRI